MILTHSPNKNRILNAFQEPQKGPKKVNFIFSKLRKQKGEKPLKDQREKETKAVPQIRKAKRRRERKLVWFGVRREKQEQRKNVNGKNQA